MPTLTFLLAHSSFQGANHSRTNSRRVKYAECQQTHVPRPKTVVITPYLPVLPAGFVSGDHAKASRLAPFRNCAKAVTIRAQGQCFASSHRYCDARFWQILKPRPLHRQRPHLDHIAPGAGHRHNSALDVPVHGTASQSHGGDGQRQPTTLTKPEWMITTAATTSHLTRTSLSRSLALRVNGAEVSTGTVAGGLLRKASQVGHLHRHSLDDTHCGSCRSDPCYPEAACIFPSWPSDSRVALQKRADLLIGSQQHVVSLSPPIPVCVKLRETVYAGI
jgi:hypothetical protein